MTGWLKTLVNERNYQDGKNKEIREKSQVTGDDEGRVRLVTQSCGILYLCVRLKFVLWACVSVYAGAECSRGDRGGVGGSSRSPEPCESEKESVSRELREEAREREHPIPAYARAR